MKSKVAVLSELLDASKEEVARQAKTATLAASQAWTATQATEEHSRTLLVVASKQGKCVEMLAKLGLDVTRQENALSAYEAEMRQDASLADDHLRSSIIELIEAKGK